jgi:polyhydroxyalkanoate synthase
MLHHLMPPVDTGEDVNALDRQLHSWMGRFTRGLSPAALTLAYVDWAIHLGIHPGKQLDLANRGLRAWLRLVGYSVRCVSDPKAPACARVPAADTRFDAEQWQRWPFNVMQQSFLLTQQWWHHATTGVRGVNSHHQEVVNFMGRQLLDMWSPSNFLLTNPEVLELTLEQQGQNLVRGWQNFVDDVQRRARQAPPAGVEEFRVGEKLAVTPGKVVYRNELMELIQYQPKAERVYAEPVLFVPAWIMKYYILDLRPGKSMVEYLLEQGHTVFMISWKNPTPAQRDMGLEEYRKLGVMTALEAITAIAPERKVHMTGYCLGGTLSLIAAAAMARDGDDRLASLTLFAAQADFTEPGELDLFIDESQVTFLEDYMADHGYLDAYQMASAFQLLRSQDLIWSRLVREYLSGERAPMIDLMAWNADTTRLPYRMHSEYMRELFLNNDLAEDRFDVEGQPIHLSDIQVPVFAVGTVTDHVAPWKSAYKITRLLRTEVTFLLTTGGHNAGIVTPPGHPRRKFQLHTRKLRDRYLRPEQFRQERPQQAGSWWPAWEAWLAQRSGERVAPPALGAAKRGYEALADAPGSYVLEP